MIDKIANEKTVVDGAITRHSEVSSFAARPTPEHYVNSFSLRSRHGRDYIVMNMGLAEYNKLIEENNMTRIRVLSLETGECYIIDDRVPYEYYK